jgi:4-amino-4-deoxy-L-arabinose transferase-like glycosyltransferase
LPGLVRPERTLVDGLAELKSRGVGDGAQRQRRVFFVAGIVLVIVAALIIRFVWVTRFKWNSTLVTGDYLYYLGYANDLAHLHWPRNPFTGRPTAFHPPLFPLLLVPGYLGGLRTPGQIVLENCVLGAVAVGLVAALAWRLFGTATAVLASAIGAFSPSLFIYDGQVQPEAAEVAVFLLVLSAAYAYLARRTLRGAAVFGALCGLLALARSEQALQFLFLAPYLLWGLRKSAGELIRHAAAMVACAALVVAPWSVHNLLSFQYPEPLSTQLGVTVETSNCPQTYYGRYLGYWYFPCAARVRGLTLQTDESVADRRYLSAGFSYLRHHLGRFPYVAFARLGRMWYFFRPFQQARLDYRLEGWMYPFNRVELYCFWASLPLVGVGLLAARARGVKLYPLGVQFLQTSLVAIAVYGQSRYRASAESLFPVLSAGGISFLVGRARRRARAATRPATIAEGGPGPLTAPGPQG